MGKATLIGLGSASLALWGCAAAMVWDRPNTSPAEYAADEARCQLLAEGANPDLGSPTIYTGKLRRDVGLNALAGLAHGIEQATAVQHTHDLCMQAWSRTRSQPPQLAVEGQIEQAEV